MENNKITDYCDIGDTIMIKDGSDYISAIVYDFKKYYDNPNEVSIAMVIYYADNLKSSYNLYVKDFEQGSVFNKTRLENKKRVDLWKSLKQ